MSAAKHRLREPDARPSGVTSRRPLSVLATVALVAGCLGFAVSHRQSADSSVLDLSGDTAWLVSTGPGMVSEVSGSVGTPDTDVTVAGIRGHSVFAAQDGSTVLVADENTGVVHAVSASNFTTGTDISLGPGSVTYLSDGTGIYGINPVDGGISYAVPTATSPVKDISLGTLAGNAEDTSDGTLWITEPLKGAVVPVRDGAAGRPVPVAPKGDDLTVATAGDAAIVVDGTTGRVIGLPTGAVGNGTGPRPPALSSRSLGLPSDGMKDLVPALPGAGPTAVFAVPGLRLLVLVNTADLDVTTISLTGARITGGSISPPLEAAGNIYVSDGSGRLLVYAANGGLRRVLPVTPGPADLNVFTGDGLIWANDPDGPDALVLDNGTARIIHKYSVSQKRTAQEPSAAPTVKPSQTKPTQAPPTQSAPTHPKATATSTSSGPEDTPAPHPSAGPGTATATATAIGSGTPTARGTTLASSPAPATAPAPAPTTTPPVPAPTTAPPPPQPTPSPSPAPTTPSPEPTQPVSSLCGTVITKDTTLTQDLNCPGEFALEIGANNVTLNLKGHTITCTNPQNGCIGINDFEMGLDNRLTRITIENGTIASSGVAISAPGIDRGRLEGISVTGVGGAECDIFVSGSRDIRIINDAISNCRMDISQSNEIWVTGNTLSNDTVSIEQTDNIWVTGNALSGSLLEPVTGSRNVNTSPNQGNWTTG
jgi:hypothetical protein